MDKNRSIETLNRQNRFQQVQASLQLLEEAETEVSASTRKLISEAISQLRRATTEEGLRQLTSPTFELQKLSLRDVVEIIEFVMQAKRVMNSTPNKVVFTWARTVESRLPFWIEVQREELVKLISSLADHAVESLGGASGVIRFDLRCGLRSVEISVEDNGRGMSDELMARLQSKGLFQTKRHADWLTPGQIRNRVVSWGGRLERQSRLGVGTRVIIEIPKLMNLDHEMPLVGDGPRSLPSDL